MEKGLNLTCLGVIIKIVRLGCKCGETLWNGLTPNDIQQYVYTDRQMDNIHERNFVETLKLFTLKNYEVWKCPKCKRLYIFDDDSNKAKWIYQLESE